MSTIRWQRFMLGAATGFGAGYLLWRTFEARRAFEAPPPAVEPDAAAYGRIHRGLALAGVLRSIAGASAVAYGPGGTAIDRIVAQMPPLLRPAMFAGILGLLDALGELPIGYIEDHILERRYGLSEQTTDDWARDYAKSAALGAGVTALVALLFGLALRRMPRAWPLVASAGTLPLLLLANIVVPIYVMPLFNRFEPLTGPLEQRLRALATRYGVGDAQILRMDMSRQTKKANAFVTGIGTTHRIVLGDTLVEHFTPDEIEFVVAHELGHYVSRDTWRMIALAQTLATTLFFTAHAAIPAAQRARLHDRPLLLARVYAIMTIGAHALRPLLLAFTRSREWAADRFAVEATREPRWGVDAFRRLRNQNLAEDDVPHWYEVFFSSHPSLGKRIASLEAAEYAE
ncbi:MAG: M48 family metallopeptidase [Vulcanimicrobiaceae bacterium]